MSDMDEDVESTWLLTAETKASLADFFVARVTLAVQSSTVARLILESCSPRHLYSTARRPNLSDIENCQKLLEEWRLDNDELLKREPPNYNSLYSDFYDLGGDSDDGGRKVNDSAFITSQSTTALSYE